VNAGDTIRIRDHDGAERIVTILGWQAGTADLWVHDGKQGFAVEEAQIITMEGGAVAGHAAAAASRVKRPRMSGAS